MSPSDVGALVDLSAAELLYSGATDDPIALLRSLDASSRAANRAPTAPAIYNRGLALDELGLDAMARQTWRTYLGIDASSEFADEARRRLRALDARADSARDIGPDVPLDSLDGFVDAAPADAFALIWDKLLPVWGRALLAGDSAAAHRALSRAERLGARLAEAHGDSSAARATREVGRANGLPRQTQRLAQMYAAFGLGQEKTRQYQYVAADSLFEKIVRERPSPAMLERASVAKLNAELSLGRFDQTLIDGRHLEGAIDTGSAPILAARVRWIEALVLLRRGRTDAGIALVHRARDLFDRAGDLDDAAGADGFEGEALLRSGEVRNGLRKIRQALLRLRNRPTSLWRHNVLLVLSLEAQRLEFSDAAHAIEDEDLVVASSGTRAVSVAEARLSRAQSFALDGRRDSAAVAVREAQHLLDAVGDSALKARLREEIHLTQASTRTLEPTTNPRALLDSAIAYFTPLRFASKLIPAYVARAQLELDTRDDASAERDLAAAADLYRRQRDEITRAAARAAVIEQARRVYEQLVMLRLAAHRPLDALDAIENSHTFLTVGSPPKSLRRRTTLGVTAVEWALIGDSLVTWVVSDTGVETHVRGLNRAAFRQMVERVRASMQLGIDESTARGDLAQLFETLFGFPDKNPMKLGGQVNGTAPLLILVPDQEIESVPFAALWDRRHDAYLAEERTIVVASSLDDMQESGTWTGSHAKERAAARPLFVATQGADGLRPLSLIDAEARDAARLYPSASLMVGAPPAIATLLDSLSSATLFHFAGHAVFDATDPSRSFLALGSQKLFASTIAAQRWPRMSLVVLAACETSRAADANAEGLLGLADSFLAAGAGQVVGTMWPVDDRETRDLMERFYRDLRATGNAAGALRAAQMESIRDPHVSLSTWSAMRLVGR